MLTTAHFYCWHYQCIICLCDCLEIRFLAQVLHQSPKVSVDSVFSMLIMQILKHQEFLFWCITKRSRHSWNVFVIFHKAFDHDGISNVLVLVNFYNKVKHHFWKKKCFLIECIIRFRIRNQTAIPKKKDARRSKYYSLEKVKELHVQMKTINYLKYS